MSTILRRKRTSRLSLSAYRRHELLTGRIVYPVQGYDGYGDGRSTNVADYISDEMKADWLANRTGCLNFGNRACRMQKLSRTIAFLGPKDRLPWAAQFLD